MITTARKIADPYRPLENTNSGETKKWIEAENKLTFHYLATVPERKKINDPMTTLWNYEKYGFLVQSLGMKVAF